MFKNIIAPVQAWLLARGQCVGCGTSLKNGQITKSKVSGHDQVTCKCGRIFLKSHTSSQYRRALLDEV